MVEKERQTSGVVLAPEKPIQPQLQEQQLYLRQVYGAVIDL